MVWTMWQPWSMSLLLMLLFIVLRVIFAWFTGWSVIFDSIVMPLTRWVMHLMPSISKVTTSHSQADVPDWEVDWSHSQWASQIPSCRIFTSLCVVWDLYRIMHVSPIAYALASISGLTFLHLDWNNNFQLWFGWSPLTLQSGKNSKTKEIKWGDKRQTSQVKYFHQMWCVDTNVLSRRLLLLLYMEGISQIHLRSVASPGVHATIFISPELCQLPKCCTVIKLSPLNLFSRFSIFF